MAERSSRSSFFDAFYDFERTVDALFDDLLISRWRAARLGDDPQIQVADRGDHYQVKMTRVTANSRDLDIEASERRLVVSIHHPLGRAERAVDFRHQIVPEAVTAELKDAELKVILPKKRAHKIAVS
jgi:HSP20 family molecular chaperone IbpA